MASFANVLDTHVVSVPMHGTEITLGISGTYDQTILFQKELGSPLADAWETLATYNTEDATEAAVFVSEGDNTRYRFIMTVDGGGTATTVLTLGVKTLQVPVARDRMGNVVEEFHQKGVRYPGGITKGIPIVTVVGLSLDAETHAGRLLYHNHADGGTVVLPAAKGTGDVYRVFVGTTVTTSLIIEVNATPGTDIMAGVVGLVTDIAGVWMCTGATADTLTMDWSTTGGIIGSYVEFEDVAIGVWSVRGNLVCTGDEADPFSAAVS